MGSIFSKAMVFLGLVDEEVSDPSDQRLADNDPPPSRRSPPVRRAEPDEWDEGQRRLDYARSDAGRRSEPRRVEPVTRVEGRRVEPPSGSNRATSYRDAADFEPTPVRARLRFIPRKNPVV